MSPDNHAAMSLMQRHETLESLISDELRHPLPDEEKIKRMKIEKLRLKDRIERLSNQR